MATNFDLKFSNSFYQEFSDIISYIQYELGNVIAAKNLIEKVDAEINKRLENPMDFQVFYTPNHNKYYRIYINNYVILYTITNSTMIVRRMFYYRRNIDELL